MSDAAILGTSCPRRRKVPKIVALGLQLEGFLDSCICEKYLGEFYTTQKRLIRHY
jgi:hypothetical protein